MKACGPSAGTPSKYWQFERLARPHEHFESLQLSWRNIYLGRNFMFCSARCYICRLRVGGCCRPSVDGAAVRVHQHPNDGEAAASAPRRGICRLHGQCQNVGAPLVVDGFSQCRWTGEVSIYSLWGRRGTYRLAFEQILHVLCRRQFQWVVFKEGILAVGGQLVGPWEGCPCGRDRHERGLF